MALSIVSEDRLSVSITVNELSSYDSADPTNRNQGIRFRIFFSGLSISYP